MYLFLKCLVYIVAGPALFMSLASEVGAARQDQLTILRVGTQGDWGYVAFTVPLVEACQWDNIYFLVNEDSGKAALSLLLTARVSGQTVARVDYTRSNTGRCMLDLVQL